MDESRYRKANSGVFLMENQTNAASVSVSAPMMVVTHPGGAHRDDFIAVAVILGMFGNIPVSRGNPTLNHLADPRCWVVDIGGEHSPTMGNFDHHQLPRESGACCALTLVLRHLGLEDQARKAWKWMGFTETMDSKGPHVAAALVGAPWSGLQQALSPIEHFMLNQFGAIKGEVTGPVLGYLAALGASLVNELKDLEVRRQLLSKEMVVLKVKGLKVLVAPESVRGSATLGLSEFQEEFHPDAAISVIPSDRDKGLALYRIKDHCQVDFRLVKDDPAVLFAHANGFCGGTKEVIGEEDLIALLEGAITPPLQKEVCDLPPLRW